jgi:hypothetical protein
VMQGKVDGKRKRWRSLNRYIDQISGLTRLSIYNLVRQAEDREAWRVIVETPMGHDVRQWTTTKKKKKRTSYEAPHYAVFSSLPPLPLS